MRYQIIKNWKGKSLVKFACPQCGSKLSERLERAGKPDICPACGTNIVIPGRKDLEKREAAAAEKKREAEKRKAEREEEEKARQAEANARWATPDSEPPSQLTNQTGSTDSSLLNFAPTDATAESADGGMPSNLQVPNWNPVEVPSSRTPDGDGDSGWIAPITPVTGQADNQDTSTKRNRWESEQNATPDVPADPQFNETSIPQPNASSKLSSSKQKNWWKDSISLGNIRETRYPALMAYRNLMVIVWMIFTSLICLAILIAPFLFGLPAFTASNSRASEIKNDLRQMRSATIQNALSIANRNTGMNGTTLENLRASLLYTDYDSPSYLYGESLTPDEASQFARSYLAWREQRTNQLNSQKPSMLIALAYAAGITLLYWLILLGVAILYTILLLVPPECIKLAIDVEHGIRTMNESPQ
ncbi:MAG: hypothetical protein P1U77_19140 [Rubripirellula sp.]|nr:hypothetical protein [Rubripirellula sp.]